MLLYQNIILKSFCDPMLCLRTAYSLTRQINISILAMFAYLENKKITKRYIYYNRNQLCTVSLPFKS